MPPSAVAASVGAPDDVDDGGLVGGAGAGGAGAAGLGGLCALSGPPVRPLQLRAIPSISVPVSSWRRKEGGASGEVIKTAAAVNSDTLLTGGPNPGSVEWLNHAAALGFSSPSEAQEAAVEAAFRRCRYNADCADDILREGLAGLPAAEAADAREELLGWWCRRCWEDRRTKEAGEAAKREETKLSRAYVLSSWCRFGTTARRASHQASAVSGGSAELLSQWRQCRDARASPASASSDLAPEVARLRAAAGAGAGAAEDMAAAAAEVVEACCADTHCLVRALGAVDERASAAVWRRAAEQFSSRSSGARKR